MSRRLALTLAVAAACLGAPAAGAPFVDVLDTPARMSPLAAKSLLQAVTRAGERLVAVGQRGHIVVSRDGGVTWTQSRVPVSSDLTGVYFVDSQRGWAVGHDGVVLHTGDGGDTWTLQLDGRKANELNREAGADKPFLDVWFADAATGYVVGAYNMIFRTQDGGRTWESWLDRTDNPRSFNLYAIRPAAGDLYIAGESGLVLKLDVAAQRFRAVDVPYAGSFFTIGGAANSVLVAGLRGTVLRSDDRGRTWTTVDAGLAGAVVGVARGPSDSMLLADAGGRVVASRDGGRTFTRLPVKQSMPVSALAVSGEGRLALVGARGVAIVDTAAR